MAVPGHDSRDFEFAEQFELPVVRVVLGPGDSTETPLEEAYFGPGRLINSGPFDGTDVSESVEVVTAWASEKGWGDARVNFRLRD